MLIKNIKFNKYKKLIDINLEFSPNINAIFGTNATCKTSILHVVGNTYQKMPLKNDNLTDDSCLKIINKINLVTNPKIENLNRGDTKFNDPAPGFKGNLFECFLDNEKSIPFRRHNTEDLKRYRVAPYYKKGSKESLPFGCIIYLGLNRLSSYGEFFSDDQIKNIVGAYNTLPESYKNDLLKTYKSFTTYEIDTIEYEEIINVKRRARFQTNIDGSDSNTISAGEDNLMILLTAIYSLVYFCNSLKNENKDIPAVLLVDELDATLHPEYQIKLLTIIRSLSMQYSNLQVFFTSHSISLLEECKVKNDNIIYLINNSNYVSLLPNPDQFKARTILESKLHRDIYKNREILVLLEDEEARTFFNHLIDFYTNQNKFDLYCPKLRYLKVIENTSFSSLTLNALFKSKSVTRAKLPFICCLDGDTDDCLSKGIIKLPGNYSPERILINYLSKVINESSVNDQYDDFWINSAETTGHTILYVKSNILTRINNIQTKIDTAHENGESARGITREDTKAIFNEHKDFFDNLIILWINDEENLDSVKYFYNNLLKACIQVAEYNSLSNELFLGHFK